MMETGHCVFLASCHQGPKVCKENVPDSSILVHILKHTKHNIRCKMQGCFHALDTIFWIISSVCCLISWQSASHSSYTSSQCQISSGGFPALGIYTRCGPKAAAVVTFATRLVMLSNHKWSLVKTFELNCQLRYLQFSVFRTHQALFPLTSVLKWNSSLNELLLIGHLTPPVLQALFCKCWYVN